MGYSMSPRPDSNVLNFRIIDSNIDDWVLVYSCDDHPRSKPYIAQVTQTDDFGWKGLAPTIRLLTRTMEGGSDKKIKSEVKESLEKFLPSLDKKEMAEVMQGGDCTYNTDLV